MTQYKICQKQEVLKKIRIHWLT